MNNTVSLKKPREFRNLYAKGKTSVGALLVVYSRRNGETRNRLGVTVSSKLGNAVARNRIRRRIKEAYRAVETELPVGVKIVIVARKGAYSAPFTQLTREVARHIGISCK